MKGKLTEDQASLVLGSRTSLMDLLRQCSQKRREQSLLPQASIPLARTCAMKARVKSAQKCRIATSRQYHASSHKLYQVCSLRMSCRCIDAGPGLYSKNCLLPQAYDPSSCNALKQLLPCHLSYTRALSAFMAAAEPALRRLTCHKKLNHSISREKESWLYSRPASHTTPNLK